MMRRSRLFLLLFFVLLSAALLAACTGRETTVIATAEPAEEIATPPLPGTGMTICQVTDSGGIDDRSFNATTWAGIERAETELGVETDYIESTEDSDYAEPINTFIEQDCDLVMTVGFLLGDATAEAAGSHPSVNFAIMDVTYDPPLDNVLGVDFDVNEAAFLAGYLAAATTETGKVGTFGGLPIPPVIKFMNGFALGVDYYNQQKDAAVEVLGWDLETQEGLFVGNFENQDDGRELGQDLLDQGADIILPVAGGVGLGTAAAIEEAGNAWLIGVDTDWTISASEYEPIILTSVVKNLDNAAFTTIQRLVDGMFSGGTFVGTLKNDGVGLAEPAAGTPQETLAELAEIRQAIIAGNIRTTP